jgi:NAD(P)H-dependent flavin oxidoreductase YrpB (nitropropane dioxygenase family)
MLTGTGMRTAFTELVGCRVPVQLAAMGGGVTTPELAIAVSQAGGLGMLQRAGRRPLADRIGDLERARAGPFGVNFVLHNYGPGDQDDVEMAASRARVVEFFWGDPDPRLVEVAHSGGALASWQVGSVEEARRAAGESTDPVVGAIEDGARSVPLPRLAARTPSRDVRGTVAAMALYAGQGVGEVTEVVPAAQVVAELVAGAQRLLGRWPPQPTAGEGRTGGEGHGGGR